MRQRRSRPDRISARSGVSVRVVDVLCPWRAGRGRGATVRRPWLRDADAWCCGVGVVERRPTTDDAVDKCDVHRPRLIPAWRSHLQPPDPQGAPAYPDSTWLLRRSCLRAQSPTAARPRWSCCSPCTCAVQRDPRRPRHAYFVHIRRALPLSVRPTCCHCATLLISNLPQMI
jgi:hypothetical protein